MPDFVNITLENVRNKLLDLTRRNRLLNYKETARSIRVVDELPDEVFRIMVQEGKTMDFLSLCVEKESDQETLPGIRKRDNKKKDIDIRNELPEPCVQVASKHRDTSLQTPFPDNVLERRCKKILQESRSAIDETGNNFLYLAIGFLEWYESDDSVELNRAPLILVPVSIEKSKINRDTNCFTYVISYTGEDIETNLSLAEKLNQDFNLILPTFEDDISPETYFKQIINIVKRRPRWRVAREIVLGIFSFSKLLMYRDLDPKRWPKGMQIDKHPNIVNVLGGHNGSERDHNILYEVEYDEEHELSLTTPLILDADSSQSSVIIDVINNRDNLVVEGPPGTGKSQTIANIIAAALHEGMSVLFVAEKKAALEVVRSRLNHAGLGDFCLELHSHKTQKGQLHSDIGRRLRMSYRDIRSLDQEISDLKQERKRLLNYSNLVNKSAGPNGETIYDIFWLTERYRSELDDNMPQLNVTNSLELKRGDLFDNINLLRELARLRIELTDDAMSCWDAFRPNTVLPGDEIDILRALNEYKSAFIEYCDYLKNCFVNIYDTSLTSFAHIKDLKEIRTDLLNELPSDYVNDIALRFTNDENVKLLEELIGNINRYKVLMEKADQLCNSEDSDQVRSNIQSIIYMSDRLIVEKYGDKNLCELSYLISEKQKVIDTLRIISDLIAPITKYFECSPNISVHTLKSILSFNETISSLKLINDYLNPDLSLVSTKIKYEEIRNKANDINRNIKEKGEYFLLRYLYKKEVLVEKTYKLRTYDNTSVKLFNLFSPKYYRLRKSIKLILTNPNSINDRGLIGQLEHMIDLLAEIENIREDKFMISMLPEMYCGVDTDWDKVDETINLCQFLVNVVGSERCAYKTIKNIDDILPHIKSISDALPLLILNLETSYKILGIDIKENSVLVESQMKQSIDAIKEPLGVLYEYDGLRDMTVSEVNFAAKSYVEARAIENNIADKKYHELLNVHYNGINTNTIRVHNTAKWVDRIRKKGNLDKTTYVWLIDRDTAEKVNMLNELVKKSSSFIGRQRTFVLKMEEYGPILRDNLFCNREDDCTLDEFMNAIIRCENNVKYIITWKDYCSLREQAEYLRLEQAAKVIQSGKIKPDEIESLYRYAVYNDMSRCIISKHKELERFTRVAFEEKRRRFAGLDRLIMRNYRERIAYKASLHNVPKGIGHGPVKDHTDRALIERELHKQRRHIPIRQLVRRAGRALQALKPCFMMSPLSVAQYLQPGEINFDILVMDEASQLKPADALGSIGRAKQMVIVGDPKQLPPTSYFDRTDGDEKEDDDGAVIEDTESILDVCLITSRKRRLRWHYRSEHESLIAFSNHRFYDDDLIIFPSPIRKGHTHGVRLHYIEDATYLKGRNRLEAEAVTLAIIEHFRNHRNESLGVATFNREQADLVHDILERHLKEKPWLEQAIKATEQTEEPFFIKNLENVQGDERDIIYVSTTYGPDPQTARVYQRFGPIAGETGWRRLNVIFTRAKRRLELFTSMKSTDIKLTEKPSRGTLELKAYLNYAETGILIDNITIGTREPDSDFELAVAKHLTLNGFKTMAQVGVAGFFIDLGVLHPKDDGEFILGVECDGASYHSAKSVRDRDRLRQEILERKGWRIHRIWSTDWFKNRDREVERLLSAVRKALEESAPVESRKDVQRPHYEVIMSNRNANQNEFSTYSKKEMQLEQVRQPDIKELKDELIEYKVSNIITNYPNEENCILRDDILEYLIREKPTTRDEFYKAVPIVLRQNTDGKQIQFLNDILEIIDAYA